MKDSNKKLMQLNSEVPILFTEDGNYFCFINMYGYFVCMCVCTTCMQGSLRSERTPDPLKLELETAEPPCGYWESRVASVVNC